jgi:hypothetical protein
MGEGHDDHKASEGRHEMTRTQYIIARVCKQFADKKAKERLTRAEASIFRMCADSTKATAAKMGETLPR